MARKSKPSPLTAINAIIVSQANYGDRRWPVSNWSKATILHWSNSLAAWNIWGPAKRYWKRDESSVTLDANLVLVPFIPKVIRPLLPKLKPLGLYGGSYEGRRRSLANRRKKGFSILYLIAKD